MRSLLDYLDAGKEPIIFLLVPLRSSATQIHSWAHHVWLMAGLKTTTLQRWSEAVLDFPWIKSYFPLLLTFLAHHAWISLLMLNSKKPATANCIRGRDLTCSVHDDRICFFKSSNSYEVYGFPHFCKSFSTFLGFCLDEVAWTLDGLLTLDADRSGPIWLWDSKRGS